MAKRFGRISDRSLPEAGFDLTSMIDVVLLLIIFFMASAQFAKTMRSPVDLPKEKGDQLVQRVEQTIFIDVRPDGTYLLMGEEVKLERLVQLVVSDLKRRELDQGGTIEVVVRADKLALGRHLNALAGAMTVAGIRDWKLAVSSEGGPA
jgi:biopolymer transport protein ExbD